ncbi:MAG: hypothetical protein AW12_00149 [Candidatus Accumulibacter sp. BA-94]|nr:hypothetical protein [Accumulibacter sp.]EXI92991.1 MAG: hypothetical protein AW12_00149 [Candidatus Accumulibacter sp. BA-94]HRD90330.1 hypothetical protein [Accumulibacter sp.]
MSGLRGRLCCLFAASVLLGTGCRAAATCTSTGQAIDTLRLAAAS